MPSPIARRAKVDEVVNGETHGDGSLQFAGDDTAGDVLEGVHLCAYLSRELDAFRR